MLPAKIFVYFSLQLMLNRELQNIRHSSTILDINIPRSEQSLNNSRQYRHNSTFSSN